MNAANRARVTTLGMALATLLVTIGPCNHAAGGEAGVAITLANYSKLPVHATAVSLDEQLFRGPVRVRHADNAAAFPLARGVEGGRAVVWLFVNMPPLSRLDMVAERTERWSESQMVEVKPDALRNGVVRVEFGKKGWRFGFDMDKAALIEDGQLDFWVDDQNRDRIMNSDPKDLGLIHFATAARVDRREASISGASFQARPSIPSELGSSPQLTVVSRLGGFAKDMTVTETFELVAGMPLLVCRVRWQNGDDKPLWIAYVGSGDGVRGRWSRELLPGPLFAATYGFRKMGNIDGQLWEFFPNTGRYYFIPVLAQGNEPLGPGVQSVPVSQLQNVAKVKQLFDAAYAPTNSGDAFVCRVGDTIVVLNSRENEDVTESYSLPLGVGTLNTLSGKIGPHAYLVGKITTDGLWLQTNGEYPDRETELTLTFSRKPQWRIEPASAVKNEQWDEAMKILKLRLAHQQGAVQMEMKGPKLL